MHFQIDYLVWSKEGKLLKNSKSMHKKEVAFRRNTALKLI